MLFIQSPLNFDGTSIIKKFSEFFTIILVLGDPQLQQAMLLSISQGLWTVCPHSDQNWINGVATELLTLCSKFCNKEINI